MFGEDVLGHPVSGNLLIYLLYFYPTFLPAGTQGSLQHNLEYKNIKQLKTN